MPAALSWAVADEIIAYLLEWFDCANDAVSRKLIFKTRTVNSKVLRQRYRCRRRHVDKENASVPSRLSIYVSCGPKEILHRAI